MKCVQCGSYFKKNMFNSSDTCEDCFDSLVYEERDVINEVINPSGRTLAVFPDEYDYNDVESFSS